MASLILWDGELSAADLFTEINYETVQEAQDKALHMIYNVLKEHNVDLHDLKRSVDKHGNTCFTVKDWICAIVVHRLPNKE